MMKFEKVIVWGHKLHSHTHSYIHGAFDKAFRHLGYETYWLDNSDDVSHMTFDNSLFITEGQVDQNIPKIKTAKYILHNCDTQKYDGMYTLNLQVYTNGVEKSCGISGKEMEPCVFYDETNRMIYQPWATDLLPEEINQEPMFVENGKVGWIGSVWGGYHGNDTELIPFINTCEAKGFEFVTMAPGSCSFEQNKTAIAGVELAPAIVGRWQKVNGYIPCRIFKNISYGKLGLTNSETVFNLLEGNVIYGSSEQLLEKYISTDKAQRISIFKNSVSLVKEKHTYLNRINSILSVI